MVRFSCGGLVRPRPGPVQYTSVRGLPPAEGSCTQAVTPGWEVVLTVDGAEYELRTDELGLQVRRR